MWVEDEVEVVCCVVEYLCEIYGEIIIWENMVENIKECICDENCVV